MAPWVLFTGCLAGCLLQLPSGSSNLRGTLTIVALLPHSAGLAARGIVFDIKGVETMRNACEKEISFRSAQSDTHEGFQDLWQ